VNGLNSMNKYPNLTVWCEHYHEKSGLKVHPSSVPVDVVLDDLMGQVMATVRHIHMITTTLEKMTERFQELEAQIHELNVQFVELEAKTDNTTLETAKDIQERWAEKATEEVKPKATKKVK
jgi:chromosome segregation ATPase